MKITAVEAIPFAIPYVKPLKFASGEVHAAEHVLVRVHTDDGVRRRRRGAAASLHLRRDAGRDPRRHHRGVHPAARRPDADRTRGGPRAVGAHRRQSDRQGRHRHGDLGCLGPHAPTARVRSAGRLHRPDAGVSHMLGFDEPATMVAEAEKIRDTYGISTFKVKVGRRPVRWTPLSCGHCASGSVTSSSCTSTATAAGPPPSRCARWPQCLTWACCSPRNCAPPTMCSADGGWSRSSTCRSSPTNRCRHRPTSPARCSAESATAISIKTARTGFTGSQRVHHLAEGLGLEVVMGNQIDGQIGTACAVAFGAAYQLTSRHAGELSNFLDMCDDLLAEPSADPRRPAARATRDPDSASRSTPTS